MAWVITAIAAVLVSYLALRFTLEWLVPNVHPEDDSECCKVVSPVNYDRNVSHIAYFRAVQSRSSRHS
jgi:hypothetical protein